VTQIDYRDTTTTEELYAIAKAAYKGSPWTKQLFENDLKNKNAHYLIVLVDNQPAGFVGGTLIIDELSISNVAIVPTQQGVHLAERMLVAYFANFAPKTRVLLEVREQNKRAIRLYERMGFEVYNVREEYYRDPVEDAYLMDVYLPLQKGETNG
jgi:ribosomal-protein-alanine N-acetyltransferase